MTAPMVEWPSMWSILGREWLNLVLCLGAVGAGVSGVKAAFGGRDV